MTEPMRRQPALDGLRAIAIIGVVCSHVHVPHLIGAAIGVEIFFVLSGFLITTLLLREQEANGRISLWRFAVRRALRLLPALVLVLLAWTAYLTLHKGAALREQTLHGILPSLFYYANWTRYFQGYEALGWLAPMWSLSVEEQFYLLWPLCLVAIGRSRLRPYLTHVLSAGCVAVVGFRLMDLWNLDMTYRRFGTHEIADQLLIGCLLAVAFERGGPVVRGRIVALSRSLLPLALAYLAVIAVTLDETPPLTFHRFFYTIGLTLVGVCAAVIVARVVVAPESWLGRVLSLRGLVWVGSVSYGVFLWHELLHALAAARLHLSPLMMLAVVLSCSLVAAGASYYLWERPFLRLKPRPPSREKAQALLAGRTPVRMVSADEGAGNAP